MIQIKDYPILRWLLPNKSECDDKEAFNTYFEAFSKNRYFLNIKEQELINRLQIKFGQRMKGM